jgi:hypothetical protein
MSDRSAALTTIKGGINRQRVKGAALSDSLYDLLNAYVTKARTVKVRPGTFRHAALSSDTALATHGLVSFDGALHIFSASVINIPTGFVLHVLQHPTDNTADLADIHFAAPFMGFLYVAAEFSNGDIFHFWLQQSGTWAANTVYKHGDVVVPTVPNGLGYVAERSTAANPVWTAGTTRAVNDQVEPTEYTGYYFIVTAVVGTNPASGTVEPEWPTTEGATVIEDVNSTPVNVPDTAVDPNPAPNSTTQERYGP